MGVIITMDFTQNWLHTLSGTIILFGSFACEAFWSVAVARTWQKFLSVLPFFAFGGGPDADCFGQIIAVEETASQIEEEISKSGLI